ncbi:sel1 repeat family protein [Helicobacter muridarum]|uniref:Beta-lactamase n=1 Tax=Helicobacter muridarum TaxID=216 RepID=A0A377PRZ4_9HELI|nr:tetratricopeptide repeat protein [Helicobacter muridarum]TLD99028.1 sel1 repeat family protein [Helicobacter muridarum]STQ85405.1 Sel1 repeat domain-containing protein [Helicobacter muridarum]
MKKRILFLCTLCLISSLNLYGADDEKPNQDSQSGTSAQSSNNANSNNIARGPVTNVPQNGGYDLRDPRYYDGRYYGGGYYQPSYPSYYGPQRYDPYDPRNYGQYYDPYDPRNYERYYYPPIYPIYPQGIPSNGTQDDNVANKNQSKDDAKNEVKWFDDNNKQPQIQLAPLPPPDIAISYAPRIPPMPYTPNNVNVLLPSYKSPRIDDPLENALADPKSASATLNAGIDAARKGDYKKALNMFNTACDQGNPAGCFGVGVMFMYGAGVQSDTQKAIRYYQKGCAGGDPTACANLGMIYDEAPNMGNNKQKAAEMYMTGCAGGDIEACNNIGWAYANGSGVPKDINKALQYYRFACDAGSQLGCYNLGLLNNASNVYGIDAAKMNPVDLNFVACNAGDIVGCANLGYIYAQGLEGAPRNYGLAAQYFNTACIGGVASSCNNLGVLYEQGRGITQNSGQALEMYSLACEAGLYNGCDNYKNLKAKIRK